MGNSIFNTLDNKNDCFCIFSDSEPVQQSNIINLENKYTNFPEDIINDIDSNFSKLHYLINKLSNENNHLSNNLNNFKCDTHKTHKQVEELVNKINSIEKCYKIDIDELLHKIDLTKDNLITEQQKLSSENKEIKNNLSVLSTNLSNIDNTMTGIISNEWNVVDENIKEKNE